MRGDTAQVADAFALFVLVGFGWCVVRAWAPRRLFCRCGFRLLRSGHCSRVDGCRFEQ